MRVKTIAAGAGAVAAVLLSAQPALAGDTDIDIDIEPGDAMPGETVSVTGRCAGAGDEGMRIVSRALGGASAEVDSDGRFSVPATVRHVRSGGYTATVICEPSKRSATKRFRVADESRERESRGHESRGHGRDDHPRGGAGTGGGGTAPEVHDGDRPSTVPALILGTVLVGGIGGVAFARSRGRA